MIAPLELPIDLGVGENASTQPLFVSSGTDKQLHRKHHLSSTQLNQENNG